MRVQDLMTGAACCVHSTDSAVDCAHVMRAHKSSFVVVLDADDRVLGVVGERDLGVRLASADLPVSTPVSVLMSSDQLLAVRPGSDARAVHEMMTSLRQFRAVVIDDAGKLVGLLNWPDLVNAGLGDFMGPRQALPQTYRH